jgi:hypothetical protein
MVSDLERKLIIGSSVGTVSAVISTVIVFSVLIFKHRYKQAEQQQQESTQSFRDQLPNANDTALESLSDPYRPPLQPLHTYHDPFSERHSQRTTVGPTTNTQAGSTPRRPGAPGIVPFRSSTLPNTNNVYYTPEGRVHTPHTELENSVTVHQYNSLQDQLYNGLQDQQYNSLQHQQSWESEVSARRRPFPGTTDIPSTDDSWDYEVSARRKPLPVFTNNPLPDTWESEVSPYPLQNGDHPGIDTPHTAETWDSEVAARRLPYPILHEDHHSWESELSGGGPHPFPVEPYSNGITNGTRHISSRSEEHMELKVRKAYTNHDEPYKRAQDYPYPQAGLSESWRDRDLDNIRLNGPDGVRYEGLWRTETSEYFSSDSGELQSNVTFIRSSE